MDNIFVGWFALGAEHMWNGIMKLEDLPHLAYEIDCLGMADDNYIIDRIEIIGDALLIIHQDRLLTH